MTSKDPQNASAIPLHPLSLYNELLDPCFQKLVDKVVSASALNDYEATVSIFVIKVFPRGLGQIHWYTTEEYPV